MRRNNAPRGHGGPLMTEHLQLHDLDLELELLKRKREIIEQQQQMLSNNKSFNQPRPFEYGNSQPRPLFQEQHQPFSNNANFSRFYNDAPPQGFGGGPLKRHSSDPPVWQAHSAPKRFSGPQSGPKKKFGAGPGPKFTHSNARQQAPNNPSYTGSQFHQPQRQWDNKPKPSGPPKSTFPSQRFNNTKGPKPQQRDFRPTMVTKSKPPPKGNRPAPNPTPDRKKLTPQAAKSSKDDDFTGDEYILRADTVPTTQMAGRLELALGNILKEIKAKYGATEPHASSFLAPGLNRKMKQAIRERLRGVMLGKPVGKVVAIVEHYRRVFPPETDSEIVEVAQTAQQNINTKLAVKLEGADTAFKYLKVNMNKLIGATLDDMFGKLQMMYKENDKEKIKEICEKIISDSADFSKDVEPDEADKSFSANGDVSIVNDGATATENGDTAVKNSETEVANGETVENAEESSGNIEETQVVGDKPSKETPSDEDKQKNEELQVNDEKPADGNSPNKHKSYVDFHKPEWKRVDRMITSLIQRRLPYILPKFKPQLMNILNAVGSYKVTKTAIIDKTQNLLNLENRIERAEKGLADTTIDLSQSESAAPTTPKQKQNNRFSYMVKILGRPTLPKRKTMQDFLDEYKPTSVKKHRNMQMLFVSFASQEAYERIVAVKETQLGNCTISIKATEKTLAKQNESLNSSAISDSPEKLIGSDLDDQINDLLTSIRNEEESGLFDTESNDVEIVPEADKPVDEAVLNEEKCAETGTEGTEKTEGVEETAEKVSNETAEKEVNNDEVTVIEDDKVDNEEAQDKVEALKTETKETGRATPTRASARLTNVTPSTVRTRRASRLAQN